MIFFNKRNKGSEKNLNLKKHLKNFNKFRYVKNNISFCAAPFKSLLFIQSGEAKVCHYNRGYSLGKYPEKSLHEIWFGKKTTEIQNAITNIDFSKGCHECKKQLLLKNYAAVGATRYDHLYVTETSGGYPALIDFQIKNTCPAECIMCSGEYSSSIRKNREKLAPYDDPFDNNFLNQLDEFIPHIKAASFTGGEPLSIEIYYKIWEKIANINSNADIYISTNAFELNDRFLGLINKLKFHFTVSIDSINQATYEHIRKNISFQNVLNNINYLVDYCHKNNRHFAVKSCILKLNAFEFPEFITFWNNKNVKVYPKPIWFPPNLSVRNLPANELENLAALYKSIEIKNTSTASAHNKKYVNSLIQQIETWSIEAGAKSSNPYFNFTTNELKEELTNKIIEQIIKINQTENDSTINLYTHRLQVIYSSITEETILKQALINFLTFPIESIIAEMERNTDEKLIARFIQASE